jgi:hypothetical protein
VLRLTCNITGADDVSAACTIASACSSVMTSNVDKGRPVCAASAINAAVMISGTKTFLGVAIQELVR